MAHWRRYFLLLVVLVILVGCSVQSRRSVTSARIDNGFYLVISDVQSIKDSPGNPYTFTEKLDAKNANLKVTIQAEGVKNLRAGFMEIAFPSASYHFEDFTYLGGLGAQDEVIVLAVQDNDTLSLGVAPIHYDQLEGKDGNVSLFELTFAPGASRSISRSSGDSRKAPTGTFNAVTLTGNIDAGSIVHLSWRELNMGDGNNDGTVNIADVAPLAQHFFSRDVDPNSPQGLADYNGDGRVDIQDIRRLAETFFTNLSGYDVEFSTDGGQSFTKIPHEGGTQPTLVRMELFTSPRNSDGRLLWAYDTLPIEGTYTYRVVPRASNGDEGVLSANTLEFTGVMELEEVDVVLPDGHPGYLLITEEAVDEVPGNEPDFVISSVQLTGLGRPAGATEFIDASDRLSWMITASLNSATISNTSPKGLLTAKDIGVVTVLAYDPDNPSASDTITIPIYAIESLILREKSQTTPADVTVPKGSRVEFIVDGIFDDNDSDSTDTMTINLTNYGVGWIIQRPVIGWDGDGNPIYESGTFYLDVETGAVFTESSDINLQSGHRAFVTTVYPPEDRNVTIGDGHRPVSNTITITIE